MASSMVNMNANTALGYRNGTVLAPSSRLSSAKNSYLGSQICPSLRTKRLSKHVRPQTVVIRSSLVTEIERDPVVCASSLHLPLFCCKSKKTLLLGID